MAQKNNLFIDKNKTTNDVGNQKDRDSTNSLDTRKSHTVEETDSGKSDASIGSSPKKNEGPKEEAKPKNLLKRYTKTLELGQQLYLKDPDLLIEQDVKIIPASLTIIENDIFSEKNKVGSYSINYYKDNIKETLTVIVKDRKVTFDKTNDTKFFGHSNCFIGEIDLSDIGELVKQLYDLDYEKHYLLYVISFRAILEDMVKRYISKRNLGLSGIFKDNVLSMINDLKEVIIARKHDSLKMQKNRVHVKFKGYENLNNFLVSVETKFRDHNYDKFLHSLTHNPTRIEYEFAREIANELILPLYMLINCLSKENII